MISPSDLQNFESIINSAYNPNTGGILSSKPLIWKKAIRTPDIFGEDPDIKYSTTTLFGIANYNVLRSWPSTKNTETGELDEESVQIYFNKAYLRQLGLLNADGYFDYNPDLDIFIMDGLRYKSMGDTASSNSLSDDLFITVILKRDTTHTGDKR